MSVLQGPKKTPVGYFLALRPPVTSPEVRWASDAWILNSEWATWAKQQRESLLAELIAHPNWFSRPPRQDILGPIFGPWAGRNMAGGEIFTTKPPAVPGENSGRAVWSLEGLIMTSASIDPVWKVGTVVPDPADDCISLFGDAETVDASDSDDDNHVGSRRSVGGKGDDGTREIALDEIAEGAPAEPTRIRSRAWEARKFLAKERVREARLKAQIAARMADKEEQRYYAQFGDLDDGESHFSDYDLTDEEGSSGDEDAESVGTH